MGVSVPDGVPNEHDRTGVVGVCLKADREVGKSEYDGGGVAGAPCGNACSGEMVWGGMASVAGIHGSMLCIEMVLGIVRWSAWWKMGRERQGLVADSGR